MPDDTLLPITDLLTIDQLPESLHLSDYGPDFLDDIFYKDLEIISESDHEATKRLTLVFNKTIGFSFPGSELRLLLNPSDVQPLPTTEIDIQVYHRWYILGVIEGFSMDDVPTDYSSFTSMISGIYDINIQAILEKLITFYDEAAAALEIPIQSIVDELNRFYALTGTIDEISFEGEIPSLEGLETKLSNLGISLSDVLSDFNLAGVVSDPQSAADVLGAIINKHMYNLVETLNGQFSLTGPDKIDYDPDLDFSGLATKFTNLGYDALEMIEDLVLDMTENFDNLKESLISFLSLRAPELPSSFAELFIPQLEVVVEDVNLAIEFPRNALVPMDEDDNILDAPATAKLTFEVGSFMFSTLNGFDFTEVSTCELKQSSILETGLSIEVTDCFIDLHEDSNIPQADADGRTLDFKGVFVDEAVIKLPKIWQVDETQTTTAVIKGEDMVIGDPGGFSGQLSMSTGESSPGDLIHLELPGFFKVSLNSFDMLFHQNSLDQTNINGLLIIQDLKQPDGTDAEVTISVTIVNDVYSIVASDFSPFELAEINVDISSLCFTIQGGQFVDPSEITGTLTFPVLNDGSDSPNPVPLAFEGQINENFKLFSVENVPTLSLFGLGVSLDNFEIKFNNEQILEGLISGTLTFPFLSNPDTGLPLGIDLDFQILDNGYILDASTSSRVNLLGLGIELGNVHAEITSSGLDEMGIAGSLFLPGIGNDLGEEVPISFDLYLSESEYRLDVQAMTGLFIAGLELSLEEIDLTFTDGIIDQFALAGQLAFPIVDNNNGQPQWIGFDLLIQDGNYIISASGTDIPSLFLGGMEIKLTELSIGFNNTGIIESATHIAGNINIPAFNLELEISITFAENGFTIEANVPVETGYVDVVDIEDLINVQLSSLSIGKDGSNWSFSFGGRIINHLVIPGIEKFVPSVIDISQFSLLGDNDIALNVGMEWPNGFKVDNIGQGGSTTVSVNQSFGDMMYLRAIQIDTTVGNKTEISARLLGTKFTLGPVNCTIEGIGFEAVIEKKSNGNLGPLDVGLGLLYPSGIAIGLDTDIFTGGGYLFFDRDNNRYAGAIELSMMDKFSLSAIGLLTTQMPDGSKGTSLLIIINTTFPTPIPLGYNFFLAGVGGLIGLHRTTNTDKLRASVVTGTIDNILFPENVMANISQIVSDLREIFPPKKDQFLIGPMAMITWSTPPLLSIELGLIIEFDDPVVIVILGVIKANIPNPENALIKLQVNFLGIIDFDQGMLSFDAALFDSRIVSFTLEGSMALRLSWGQIPDFALSVGGFHPAYTAPTHLKFLEMRRLTISLMGGNPRLTLTSYFAVTTNTVQFGAAIDFYFKVSKFKVIGGFGFDVLFMFDPFRFIAQISAGLAVMLGSTSLFSITLKFALSGPSPWIASGTASFKIWFIKYSAKFNKTFGEEKRITLPDINVMPLVIEAIQTSRNWKSEIPVNRYDLVVLRNDEELEEGEILLQPCGEISFSQKTVPLGIEIQRYGNNKAVGETLFEIDEVGFVNADGETPMTTAALQEDFVPSNFKEMEDDDKLSSPSFTKMRSGFKGQGVGGLNSEFGYYKNVEYEVILSDETPAGGDAAVMGDSAQPPSTFQPDADFFAHFAKGGASRNNPLAKRNRARTIKNSRKVKLKSELFALVWKNSLVFYESEPINGPKAEINEKLLQAIQEDSSLAGKLMVVPSYKART